MKIFQSILEDACSASDMEWRDNYSARGMYGDKCVCVIGTFNQFAKFMIYMDAAQREEEDILYVSDLADWLADTARMDTMMYDSVFYWPGLTIEN